MIETDHVQQATLVVEKFDSYIKLLVRRGIVGHGDVDQAKNELAYFIGSVTHMNDVLISNWFNFDFVKEASSLLEYEAQKYTPFVCHILYITRSYLSDEDCNINMLRSCVYKALKLSTEQSKGAPIIDTKVLGYRTMPDTELNNLLESSVFLVFMTILLNFHSTSVMETTELLLSNTPSFV